LIHGRGFGKLYNFFSKVKVFSAWPSSHLLSLAGANVKPQVCVLCGKLKVNMRLIFSKLFLAHILFDEMSYLVFLFPLILLGLF
jgi:hypothetical protein